ncbi:MAG: 16S rRNA (uracil(1498)-N(3))-methyltransferase [Oscillospiraceae bacterium]|nr:16S rRNA (uracil(1498)-N(3))-methyltransferase [Oscillospiraceae bacterium]
MDSIDEQLTVDMTERWRYPRFFVEKESVGLSPVHLTLNTDDMNHAKKVLRIKRGEKVIICDGSCTDYLCEYIDNDKFGLIKAIQNNAEASVYLRLFQCLPKSDKMDFIVQKAVELGASEVVPIISSRCVSRPDSKSAAVKLKRWNKIAYEAAKQCGRGKIPSVGEILPFAQAIDVLNKQALNIIFYECGGVGINDAISNKFNTINVFIGSEGGFTEDEIKFAEKHRVTPATLGKRILRVDTACVAAISVIMNITGNI